MTSILAQQIATQIAKWIAIPHCYPRCYRDWPKYLKSLKYAGFRFLRTSADPSLPTRARGQHSEQIYNKLKILINIRANLGGSVCLFFYFIVSILKPYPFFASSKNG